MSSAVSYPVSLLACHGRCRPDPQRRAHHDRLLAVETDPDALLDLLELAVTWRELDWSDAGVVPPEEWLDFAERHRWQDPGRALRIFGLARDVALRGAPARTLGPALAAQA